MPFFVSKKTVPKVTALFESEVIFAWGKKKHDIYKSLAFVGESFQFSLEVIFVYRQDCLSVWG